MVGGSLWRITTPEEEHIVYAVHYNHKREAHLNAAVLDTAFLRPAVLITDAENALSLPENRASRDKEFQDAVVSNLRQGGELKDKQSPLFAHGGNRACKIALGPALCEMLPWGQSLS